MPVTPYLEHFGILGMKWGQRRYQNSDGTLTEAGKARYYKQIDREARKDAKRYVDAKQYYGKGAGNRRKLLKGELSKKMANKDYKEAFDRHVANADYEAATRRAKAERGARDTAAVIKRGAKFAVAAAAVAIPVAVAYNNMKTGSNQSIEDYTAELLRKNLGKFNL